MNTTRHPSTGKLARIARAYLRLIELIGIWGIAMVTTIAIMQVVFRYVIGASLFWSEEVMRYAIIWIVFLVAGLAYSRGEMIGVDFVPSALPPRLRRIADLIGRAGIVVLLLVLAWYGTMITIDTSTMVAPALNISMSYMHAAVPVGSVLLALHVIAGHYIVPDIDAPGDQGRGEEDQS